MGSQLARKGTSARCRDFLSRERTVISQPDFLWSRPTFVQDGLFVQSLPLLSLRLWTPSSPIGQQRPVLVCKRKCPDRVVGAFEKRISAIGTRVLTLIGP